MRKSDGEFVPCGKTLATAAPGAATADGAAPARSIPGIVVAAAAVIFMPLLAMAKRWVAAGIERGP
jgi:hypothetical protein